MTITIGSRKSRLAVIQAEMLMEKMSESHPGLELRLLTMTTTGDQILNQTLDTIGGKGLFLKELEKALLDGQADVLVHSLKDMPMELDDRIPIVALSSREDPRDVLVLPEGVTRLDLEKPVGCSSRRRALQLQELLPGSRVQSVRGNVLSRLEKLDRGEYGALVLAYAGLIRLGLGHRASRVFEPEEMVPAAGQGILALQAHKDIDRSLFRGFHDPRAWDIAMAERSFVRTLEGGCSLPIAAHARLEGDRLSITGFYQARDGAPVYRRFAEGHRRDAVALGRKLALETLKESESDG